MESPCGTNVGNPLEFPCLRAVPGIPPTDVNQISNVPWRYDLATLSRVGKLKEPYNYRTAVNQENRKHDVVWIKPFLADHGAKRAQSISLVNL